jgi:hypothetical protein
MFMRTKMKFCFMAILILNVILIAPAAPPEQSVLLKIAPPSEKVMLVVAAVGGVVVQELQSCLLVSAPPAALPRLQAEGLSFTAVSYPIEGESYFLLHSALPSPLLSRQDRSHCRLLEEGIWLLWTIDPDFRDRLVQPFHLKALQLSGTFPGRFGINIVSSATDEEKSGVRHHSGSVIPDLVAEVSVERLRADILTLQNFKTRYASTPQCEAAGGFILEHFRQMGLSAATDPFNFASYYESKNIVAVIPGKVAPERMVLACAHYDSYSTNPLVSAPGADDNASGTAAILELAQILADKKFDFSIVLLCVSAEEWGLYGSAHYARQAREDGAKIIAVVDLDMIAYPGGQQRVLKVIGNQQSEWLADHFIAIAQPYVSLRLNKVINPSLTWSDHSSFWDQNYSALCGIEDSNNPYYHHISDTLDTLDLDFTAEVVKASLATVADLAQPFDTLALAAPTGLQSRSQISAALFTSLKTVYLSWRTNSEPLAGYHVFRANKSHGPYLRLTVQPIVQTQFKDPLLLPDQSYFYVLSAVDQRGRESNYSEEVKDDENN